MNKLILAVAVAAGVAISDARADFGTPPRPAPAGGNGGEPAAANQYGWNPILKKVFWWKKGSDCATGNCGGKAGCAGGNCATPNTGPVGGTLVFPTHPYARSPRDYFMFGQGGN